MQLIKDFNDIPRFVNFLNPEYQEKLLSEINLLVIKFMDEQTKGVNPINKEEINTKIDVPSVIEKPSGLQPIQTIKPQMNLEASAGINALKSNFGIKGNMPPPPPLPSQQTIAAVPMQISRGVGAGNITIKGNFAATRPLNKKPVLSIVDAWGFITPILTELGDEEVKKPSIKTEVYQFLKQVNGESNLKEIYLFTNPSSNLWAKFLEIIYPLYKERCLNLKKSRSFPTDTDVSIKIGEFIVAQGLINQEDLEKSLEYQKNPPPPVQNQNQPAISNTQSNWMDRAKSMIGQNEPSSASQVRKKLGEIMVELKLINKDELDNALTLQKWIKNIIEHS